MYILELKSLNYLQLIFFVVNVDNASLLGNINNKSHI